MLETRFTQGVVGGVSIGVDHVDKKLWMWADCNEKNLAETEVLNLYEVVKTGEFQPYEMVLPWNLNLKAAKQCTWTGCFKVATKAMWSYSFVNVER